MLGKKVINQDLTNKEMGRGTFLIELLFNEKVVMPTEKEIEVVLSKRFGDIDCVTYGQESASYATKEYVAEFEDGNVPVMLTIISGDITDEFELDPVTLSQMWECPDSEDILKNCKYHVAGVDMLGSGIQDYKKRAHLLCEYAEALVELFPTCTAILFRSSGKMYTKDDFIRINVPEDVRFIKYAVNVRFFNIEGTDDMIVDTLGMGALYLPDLQYHFHDMDPNWVVNHAYNVCTYNYENNAPIESGETIDGIVDGRMDRNLQWKCQYEDALVQPVRMVMDINMGDNASGGR